MSPPSSFPVLFCATPNDISYAPSFRRRRCSQNGSASAVDQLAAEAPSTTSEVLHHHQPQAKRRRAKRTEEERIDYLRSDPYVAKFEAYRVLCASCDKWIRLRPNSTYCSIPWDAHRKSCLAKRV